MVSTLDQSVADGTAAPVLADEAQREWRRAVAVGVGAFVISRLIVLFGAYARAAQVVTDRQTRGNPYPQSTRPMIEAIFTQWDGKWYRMIAEHGYPSELPERITYITGDGATVAFFPVYPYVARWFDVLVPGGIVQALLGVNVVLSVVAVVLVGLLARDLFGTATAQRAMVLFALFPGSVVLSWSYAEPALIVCAAACLLFLQREQWALAGVAAAIGTATRPNGIAIVAACAVAAAIAIYRRRQWRSLIAVALAPAGVVGYHAYLRLHTGEWWAWNRAQREAWDEGWSWGATAIRFTWRFLENPLGTASGATYLHTAVALALLGFGLFCSIRVRLPWPMLAYVAVIAVLMIGPDTVSARPRFVFTAFPLVLGIAAWWPRRPREAWDGLLLLCAGGLAAAAMFYGAFAAIP
jgi:4-amino-4-deoxy-L-arabinose transferase-like glycosyltransferase